MQTQTCLVLMFKSPQHSKRRLAAEIGARAQTAAQHLIDCAIADLGTWQGPICFAPAHLRDMHCIGDRDFIADVCVEQSEGNLGDRIAHVNRVLLETGYKDQLFIGIDCPALDSDYLLHADAVLRNCDVVLGPADDGGVVLMGIRGQWPALSGLPWSTPTLRNNLMLTCKQAQLSIATLAAHRDVDCARDLKDLAQRLKEDQRPSRRRLCDWINSESFA